MNSVFNTLLERGFIAQSTSEDGVRKMLGSGEPVTFYIGFDPTADSLHVGHFIPIMVMTHLQRAGHRPIALMGGGTTMVGDPTGRTDMRNMMEYSEIEKFTELFKEQFSRFISFDGGAAIIEDNANWLLKLNYVEFLREIGVHFSINRMLTADCYKSRLEKGLSFLEFNYMLMQSYDFLELYRRYGCLLQIGGDDQWSNIISGADLIRRKEGKEAHGLTLGLLTTAEGVKMGKTQKGALWLDAKKTPPFEFFQYFRNVQDSAVGNSMRLLTFLPMDEIKGYEALEGSALNGAKKTLAYETTKLVHGVAEAKKCLELAEALFEKGDSADNIATTALTCDEASAGISLADLLIKCGLSPSRSESRRLIAQGGIAINGVRAAKPDQTITSDDFADGSLIIQKGKKVYHRVRL